MYNLVTQPIFSQILNKILLIKLKQDTTYFLWLRNNAVRFCHIIFTHYVLGSVLLKTRNQNLRLCNFSWTTIDCISNAMLIQLVSSKEIFIAELFVADVTENSGGIGRLLPFPCKMITRTIASRSIKNRHHRRCLSLQFTHILIKNFNQRQLVSYTADNFHTRQAKFKKLAIFSLYYFLTIVVQHHQLLQHW